MNEAEYLFITTLSAVAVLGAIGAISAMSFGKDKKKGALFSVLSGFSVFGLMYFIEPQSAITSLIIVLLPFTVFAHTLKIIWKQSAMNWLLFFVSAIIAANYLA